jgi:hypothetical protein
MNDHNISIKQATDQLKHHKQTQRKNEETPILRNKDLSIDKNPEFALEMKSRHFQSMTDNLYATLGSFKDNESDQMIEWYYDMYGYETVFHHVLIPLLKQVGDDWEGGKLSIAQEHFISQFVIRRIYGIYRLLPTNDSFLSKWRMASDWIVALLFISPAKRSKSDLSRTGYSL